jgi:argininosuccinate lyase
MQDKHSLWGGRFNEKADSRFNDFNSSFRFDYRLFEADIEASKAYAEALAGAGIFSQEECEKVCLALEDIKNNGIPPEAINSRDFEDVHTFIESSLVSLVGDLGKKLHTGRSRNDQVATAFRLWIISACDEIIALVKVLCLRLTESAERNFDVILPGYTHLQRAQPILWSHWCLAYFEMLARDRSRFLLCRQSAAVLPLGSGALAGTSASINRNQLALNLGFTKPSANSLDAVSDRDFALDFTYAASALQVHLSRLAEDLILYSSQEFGFVLLSDKFSSGSSLMPQKKNPDALELIRGKSGRIFGNHFSLLAMLKALPLAYNKDLQEDKEAVFDTFDTICGCLEMASLMIETIELDQNRCLDAAQKGYLNATELADYLVRRGIPFRSAHEIAGRAVLRAIEMQVELNELSIEDLRKIEPIIDPDVYDSLKITSTLATKSVIGGTAPEMVKQALIKAKNDLNSW